GRTRGKRHGLGRLAPRRAAAEGGPGRRDDAGWLGAHAQHASAARGQDLEIEVVERRHTEGLARVPQSLLDGLSREFLVASGHLRLPRRLVRPRCLDGLTVPAEGSSGRLPRSVGGAVDDVEPEADAAAVTGNRGVWSAAKDGVHPNSGKSEPQPTIRYCCPIENRVVA